MSTDQYAISLLGGLDDPIKKSFTNIFRYLVPNTKWGPISHQAKSENFGGVYLQSTTATSTSEFSIVHGLGRTPYLMAPVADLTAVGSGMPTLRVSRAADGSRVYLKADAGSTNLPFAIYVE
jgi:hypothetical protein